MSEMSAIVIKPALKCNAACAFCSERRTLHDSLNPDDVMGLADWRRVLSDAKDLGVVSLHISGGEPTLYPELVELVELGKTLGMRTNINTNGSRLLPSAVGALRRAGLDACSVSLYSHDPNVHDSIKGVTGMHTSAVHGVKCVQDAGISAYAQTILAKANMHALPEYLEWLHRLGVEVLFISYVEGGSHGLHPTPSDIESFLDSVVPRCRDAVCRTFAREEGLRARALQTIERLFRLEQVTPEQLSRGFYGPQGGHGCGVPRSMVIVLGNGDVHPCNAVEYFHKPVVGNVLRNTLTDIWRSEERKLIGDRGSGWCHRCPIRHHSEIWFAEDARQAIRQEKEA